jgi:protein-S-isoprenylcysteine O-methyltransferase Ste14
MQNYLPGGKIIYMENIEQNTKKRGGESIHFVLAHAYMTFFFCVMFGVLFDILVPFDLFENVNYSYFGLIFILAGSFMVYWAQKSSNKLDRAKKENVEDHAIFMIGPYKFIKHPTYLGLFTLSLGFSILTRIYSIHYICNYCTYNIKLTFVKKGEKILENKYGDKYVLYKNKRKKKA